MTINATELIAPIGAGGKRLEYVNQKQDELLTTGMSKEFRPYNIQKNIEPTLGKVDFGGYSTDFWSCHERALKGIAHLRYYNPGCRTALALGERGVKELHSLVVIWDAGGNEGKYYDTTGVPENRIIEDFVGTKIVNFPPPGVAANSEEVPGFEKPKFRKMENGFLILNPTYEIDALANFMKELNALSDKIAAEKNFPAPAGVDQNIFDAYFKGAHDRVLFECMKLREKFKHFPIGMAFGELTTPGKGSSDSATLVFWKGSNSPPIYWGLRRKNLADMKDWKFVPRVVIV